MVLPIMKRIALAFAALLLAIAPALPQQWQPAEPVYRQLPYFQ